jgi:hypothetical protein
MNPPEQKRVAAGVLLILAALAAALVFSATSSESSGPVDVALRTTAQYNDLAAARRDGYGILKDKQGIACIAMTGMPSMAMGVHYVRPALVSDGVVHVATPEALVYEPTSLGLRLAALEYVVLQAAWDARHAQPPVLYGHRFALTPAGNRFGLPAFYSLHAWIWKPNPSGEFAMWNPTVHCSAGVRR